MTTIGTFLAGIPRPIRDFLESLATAAVVAASVAVAGLNLSDPNLSAKAVLVIVAKAALDGIIAKARRGLPTG